ncbi:MAG TPA: antibiotic biosynthesis monooxygenase [Candidatus Acidoferrales bacterium]|nr:antibiotic biosynthesis monooxygenase [Candidatus Acidoferrales bacterium]
MHARVTQFHIVPEQLRQFMSNLDAAIPLARQQQGFCGVFVLRAGEQTTSSVDVRVISLWNSLEDLQAGEQNFYFYQALAKVMSASKGFPLIESHEVLFADFGNEAQRSRGRDASSDETNF